VRIFLSYRREDASGHAGRLYDALAARFGESNVFIDIDTIDPGADFGEAITRAVGSCDALIALIGRRWLDATDAEGRRRLDDTGDFVRLELEAALERDVAVIPAFVQEAEPPPAERLPPSLAPLSRRQGAALRDVGWHDDVKRLIARLEGERVPAPARPRRRALLLAGVAAAILVATAAGLLLARDSPNQGSAGATTSPDFTDDQRALLATVPPGTRATCDQTEQDRAARASIGCSGAGLFVAYHQFAREQDMEAWYSQRRELQQLTPGSGACTPERFRGETVWDEGDLLCYVDTTGEPYLVWTDPRADVVAVANMWDRKGRPAIESLLRQWECCLGLEP
jgi:hypothetical protein